MVSAENYEIPTKIFDYILKEFHKIDRITNSQVKKSIWALSVLYDKFLKSVAT